MAGSFHAPINHLAQNGVQILIAGGMGMQAFAAALASNPAVNLHQVISGAEALEAARTTPPHLVIIDADLPDTAPLELVQKLLMSMPW